MLVERNFDFQLTGSDESLRFNLHGGSCMNLNIGRPFGKNC